MTYTSAMPRIAETLSLVDNIVRLRRAERVPRAASNVAPVRRQLESQLGPTLSRSRASKILGVSQTALDRWVAGGQIPVAISPSGRREVPRQVVIELRESIDRLKRKGITRHPLGAALAERRDTADRAGPANGATDRVRQPIGHDTAARRGLAYHKAIAGRLDDRTVADARERLERLSAEGHLHRRYAERWRDTLALPIDKIAEAIAADTQDARDLRQSSPFAGVLNEHERRRIIETA
jgi:DNA-binding transcriptional MerR regulator